MAFTNADAFFAQIEEDWAELSKRAAREAATKAQKDIREKADKFIKEYYAYNPKVYTNAKRKKALYKLVEDFYEVTERPNGIEIEFGVTYNPENIKGIHRSNSRYHQSGDKWISVRSPRGMSADIPTLNDVIGSGSDNGIPEPEWITEQFLAGIHPWSAVDEQSPDEKMQDFFDTKIEDLINEYISSSLLNAIREYF